MMKSNCKRFMALALSLVLLLMATGCGGGGDTSSDVSLPNETAPTVGSTTSAVSSDTSADTSTVAGTTTTKGGSTTKTQKKTTTTTQITFSSEPLASNVKTWAADALTDVFETTAMPAKAATSGELHMLKNEAESLQVAVRPEGGALNNVSVTVEPVNGLSVSVYLIGHVKYRKNSANIGDYSRAPAGTPVPEYYMNSSIADSIAKGTTATFCVEAISTAKTKAGTYNTNIVIRSKEGTRKLPLQIRVYNGTLPEPKDSEFSYTCRAETAYWPNNTADKINNTFYDIDGYDENFWKLQENYAKVMKKERQNVLDVPIRELLGTGLTIKADGTYQFDFTTFDRFIETYLKHGSFKLLEGSHVLDKDWYIEPNDKSWPTNATDTWVYVEKKGEITTEWVYTNTPEAQKHLQQLLTALYKHLKEKGWDKMWVQHVADEVEGVRPRNEVAATYDLVHQLMPGIKTLDAGLTTYIYYSGKLDIPIPRLDNFQNKKANYEEMSKTYGATVWTYTCDGPQGNSMSRLNDFPLLSTRALGWYMWQNNVNGYLHWAWNLWDRLSIRGLDPFNDIHCAGGPADGFLVYPDLENLGVLEGTRATAMRDALEDNELMRLAAKKNSAEVKKIVDELVRSSTDFERDPAKFLQARIKMLQMLG